MDQITRAQKQESTKVKTITSMEVARMLGKTHSNILRDILNNPGSVSLLSGDRKPQIRFLGNHHSDGGNLYHKSFRM